MVDECHWSCPEAAELSRLSEKLTEFFCFHHKVAFQSCGISERERESFCSDLHQIRRIRHCAVHRVIVNAATIGKYAKSAQNVLAILKRLGGAEFEKAFGGQVRYESFFLRKIDMTNLIYKLNQFMSTFWGISGPDIPLVALNQSYEQQSGYSDLDNLLAETKTMNIRRMFEVQDTAMERRLENIGRMIENIEISQRRKADRQARVSQQNEEAERRRIERAQRNQKERENAEQKRQERARRAQQEVIQRNVEHS